MTRAEAIKAGFWIALMAVLLFVPAGTLAWRGAWISWPSSWSPAGP